MATELLELQLEELSLVDRPANAEAVVTLFKRDDTQEEDIDKMTDEQEAKIKAYMDKNHCGKEEAMKALGYDVEKAADDVDPILELEAKIETLKAENERLRKGLIDEGYVIRKLKRPFRISPLRLLKVCCLLCLRWTKWTCLWKLLLLRTKRLQTKWKSSVKQM